MATKFFEAGLLELMALVNLRNFFILYERTKDIILESIPVFACGFKSHMELNTDLTWNYYFGFQILNLDFHSAYNGYKFIIQILWFYNLILYKYLYWASYTLKSSQIQLHTRNIIYNKLLHTTFLDGIYDCCAKFYSR